MVRKKDNWKQKYKESIHDVNDNSNTAGKSDFSFIVAEDIGMNTIKANFFFSEFVVSIVFLRLVALSLRRLLRPRFPFLLPNTR